MSKKLVVMILGAILIVALAATAYAETKVAFEGSYRIRGYYLQNTNVAVDTDDEDKSSYFDHRWRLEGHFMPNDNVAFHFRGDANQNQVWGGAAPVTGATAGVMEIDRMYMTIKTAYGSFKAGLSTGGFGGLYGLGLQARPAFDTELDSFSASWANKFGPLLMVLVYEKIVEIDMNFQPTNWSGAGTADSDQDFDHFIAIGNYDFANGAAGLWVHYFSNKANPAAEWTMWKLNPALKLNFGPVTLGAELMYATGNVDYAGGVENDREGIGYYMEGSYNYGPGSLAAWYMYTQGEDDATDDNEKGFVGTGDDFEPLLLVYEIGLPTYDLSGQNANNHWTFGLAWNHSLTESLMLSAAFGYVKLNEVPDGWDDTYGSEVDFGLSYNVMANLDYNATFGYFMPGDAWKAGGALDDPNSAWAFKHELVMNF